MDKSAAKPEYNANGPCPQCKSVYSYLQNSHIIGDTPVRVNTARCDCGTWFFYGNGASRFTPRAALCHRCRKVIVKIMAVGLWNVKICDCGLRGHMATGKYVYVPSSDLFLLPLSLEKLNLALNEIVEKHKNERVIYESP